MPLPCDVNGQRKSKERKKGRKEGRGNRKTRFCESEKGKRQVNKKKEGWRDGWVKKERRK